MSDWTFQDEEVAADPVVSGDYPVNPALWVRWKADDGEGNDDTLFVPKGSSVIGQVSGIALSHSEGMAVSWASEDPDKYPDGKVAYLKLRKPDGVDQIMFLSLADLKGRVQDRNPAVGDKLKVTYVGQESFTTKKGHRRTKKIFEVRIKRASVSPEERQAWLESTNQYMENPEPMSDDEAAAKAAKDAEAPF